MNNILELDKLSEKEIAELKAALGEDHEDRIMNMNDVQLKNFAIVLERRVKEGNANKQNLASLIFVKEELAYRGIK